LAGTTQVVAGVAVHFLCQLAFIIFVILLRARSGCQCRPLCWERGRPRPHWGHVRTACGSGRL